MMKCDSIVLGTDKLWDLQQQNCFCVLFFTKQFTSFDLPVATTFIVFCLLNVVTCTIKFSYTIPGS